MGEYTKQSPTAFILVEEQLEHGWSFRQTDKAENAWLPVAKVPSTVHQDLVDSKVLADPFIGFTEIKAEWVGKESWTYRTTFDAPSVPSEGRVVLVFEGLDTFAQVTLNEHKILESDNMFLPHRVDITDVLKRDQLQDLSIVFESALLKARALEAEHPEHKYICFNGEGARVGVRKAQYHWGWDWGPLLMCAGIWKPVRLETFVARISEVNINQDLTEGNKNVKLDLAVSLEGDMHDSMVLEVSVMDGDQEIVQNQLNVGSNSGSISVDIENPRLWMPAGYGKQNFYHVKTSLLVDGQTVHSVVKRIGIRKVELVQQPDELGKSFYFRINDVDIFCGGSCWIPADSFLTNVTKERLRNWIQLMALGNQKMIRVWGGGIYEDDAFYDACDDLGILVWQDFMFGCGNYPAHPAILKSVEAEAVANVRRLRHHPCITIYAGNNEDYQVQEQAGLHYDYADKNEENWLASDFPARYIYESLLPKVMSRECPSVPYHPGSPWGDGKISSDPTVGDMHQWNVWHGTQEKYQIFDSLGGRFNSEFGMEAFPHIATIKYFVEDERDLHPQSHVIDFHNKADGHERRLATYMVENVRLAPGLEAHIYLTQLVQSETLMFGYRGWRKQWGQDRHCGGALVWQLNDCWPTISWSICDYFLRRKPAYYSMSRVLAPLAVGVRREHHDWSITHARQPATQSWELWAVSSLPEQVTAEIELRFVSVETGADIKEKIVRKSITLQANGTTDVLKGSVDNFGDEPHVLAARMWVDGQLVARDTDWPQPLKYLRFPSRGVEVQAQHDKIRVSVKRPVKCLVFEERVGCHLSDSGIDLIPGDDQVVSVSGMTEGDQPLSWTYLGINES